MSIASRKLLDFIVEKQMPDAQEYLTLKDELNHHFLITQDGKEASQLLIERIVIWENGSEYDSLESVLSNEFTIKPNEL